MTNVTPIRDEKHEKLMRPQEFCSYLREKYGLPPRSLSERWLLDKRNEGLPQRRMLKRYVYIPVDEGERWLRAEGYLG